MGEDNASREDDGKARFERLLRARAERLAQRGRALGEVREAPLMLHVGVGGRRCVLEARWVKRIVRYTSAATIPGEEGLLRSVLNVRGRVFPVLDLGALLGVQEENDAKDGYVVLLGRSDPELGVRVDGVDAVAPVVEAPGDEPPVSEGFASSRFVRGLRPTGLVVLDAEALVRVGLEEQES